MRHTNQTLHRSWRLMVVALTASSFLVAFLPDESIFSALRREGAVSMAEPQSSPPTSETKQAQKPGSQSKTAEAKKQSPASEQKTPKDPAEEDSPEQKKQLAMTLVDGALLTAQQITPPEYGLLVQVEAATLLWQFERDRALSLLQNAFEKLQTIEEKSDTKERVRLTPKERLRSSILRKIARLNPDLFNKLTPKEASSKPRPAQAGAIMQVAEEKLSEIPEEAARLAEQSLSFGFSARGWTGFLYGLRQRDPRLAEQSAITLMNWLRDNSRSASSFQWAGQFALSQESSAQLRDYYFQAYAARLRRDVRPDLPIEEVRLNLWMAQDARETAARTSPRSVAEFTELIAAFERLFQERGLAVPGRPPAKRIDMSSMLPAEFDDTQEIRKEAQRVAAISDSKVRDQEYRKLATNAALRDDLQLAEDLMAKIENDQVRRETSVRVYSPLVWKAIRDADWIQARVYALKVRDPLGRALMLTGTAQRMPHTSEEERARVKEIYDAALASLQPETPTENVARAYLMLAQSLGRTDATAGVEAVKLAVYVLNKVTASGQLGTSEVISALQPWISARLTLDETLDVTELIGPIFQQLAKRDAEETQAVAAGLTHQALFSLARLGIAQGLLEKSATAKGAAKAGPHLNQ